MDYQKLSQEAETVAKHYFLKHIDPRLVYHTLEHTQDVVRSARELAMHYELSEEDLFVVNTAAVFHDTGYLDDIPNHEEKSAALAGAFLSEYNVPEEISAKVKDAIRSTKMPQQAPTLIDEIVCDADLFHLGLPTFREKAKLLHKEMENLYHRNIGKKEWLQRDIDFLKRHNYHTEYARLLLNTQKQKNIRKLWEKLGNKDLSEIKEDNPDWPSLSKDAEDKAEHKKDKGEKPDKGIETMFRITSANNQRLSDMADNKAHILITVNSIVLSLIVSLLLRRLDDNTNLIIPTFILLMVSLACIVVSIRSTRPSIPNGQFKPEDVEKKTVNLLFFGNFYSMSLNDYAAGMRRVMNDRDFLYGTLIKDIYAQGVVLGRKYKLIRVAYNIFMWGLITAVLAFIIAIVVEEKR